VWFYIRLSTDCLVGSRSLDCYGRLVPAEAALGDTKAPLETSTMKVASTLSERHFFFAEEKTRFYQIESVSDVPHWSKYSHNVYSYIE